MVDFALIKTNLKTIFGDANTATAAYDLSTSLASRVKKISSIHPQRIPLQASWYPYVSMFVEAKDIELKTIAINQSNAKRLCTVRLKIVGGIWNSTIPDKAADKADDQCELLMENIEEVIRRNPTLNNACLWQMPTGVTYHNKALDEEAHLRVGILSLNIQLLS